MADRKLVALITSDMHASNGDKRDPFAAQVPRWTREITALGDLVHDLPQRPLIVLNGDTVDLWEVGTALRTMHTSSMLNDLAWLLCCQDSDRVHVLLGNHDRELERYHARLPKRLEVHKRLLVQLEGFGVMLITHGDEWDPINGWFPGLGRAATRAARWIGGIWPAAERWLCKIGARIQQGGRYGNADVMLERIRTYLCGTAGLNAAVVGHSHVADYRELVNSHVVRYWNIGTWETDGWLRLYSDGSWDRWKLE